MIRLVEGGVGRGEAIDLARGQGWDGRAGEEGRREAGRGREGRGRGAMNVPPIATRSNNNHHNNN